MLCCWELILPRVALQARRINSVRLSRDYELFSQRLVLNPLMPRRLGALLFFYAGLSNFLVDQTSPPSSARARQCRPCARLPRFLSGNQKWYLIISRRLRI